MRTDPYLAALQQAAYGAIGIDAATAARTAQRSSVHIMLMTLAQAAAHLDAAEYRRHRRAACIDAYAYGRFNDSPDRLLTSFDALLADITDSVLGLAREMIDERPLNLPCGALPTGSIEGMILAAPPPSRYLLVVTDEWFPTFANLLAKVLAKIAASLEVGDREVLAFGSPTVTRFLELMLATLANRPAAAPQYFPEPDPAFRARLQTALVAIETFVVARLVLHIALGHATNREPRRVALPGVTVDAFQFDERQVHRADTMALLLTLRIPALAGAEQLAMWSIDVFLATLAMLEHAQARASGPGTGEQAQPTGGWPSRRLADRSLEATMSKRRVALRESLAAIEKQSAAERGTSTTPIAEVLASLDFVPQILWRHLCAVLDAN